MLVALDRTLTRGVRVGAVATVAALAACSWRLGVPALRTENVRLAVRYVWLAIPLTAGLFALAPVGAALLAVLYPQVWILLTPRRAVLATVALDAAITVIALARADGHQQTQIGWLVVGALSLLFALLLGIWITRVVEQSRQRADLIRQLAAARERVAELSREAGAAAERGRMAAEIHDTVAQGFTSLLILLEAIESRLTFDPVGAAHLLGQARLTARENLAEARALASGDGPPDLVETSLPEALRRLVDRAWPEPGTRLRLTVCGQPRPLPTEQEVTVLRTAQEALTNARRHSGATSVRVDLDYRPGETVLQISDDGRGFDPGAASGAGFGLTAMRSRAQVVGARLSVAAQPSAGVTVRLLLPADLS